MKEQEWKYQDRNNWPKNQFDQGWGNEPDKKQWEDKETGFPCLIVRGTSGALCGYVGIPNGHPFFEKEYFDVPVGDVHGGLTFSNHCSPYETYKGVCHIVEDGEDDNVWWLGFDCGHSCDYIPGFDTLADGSYRNMDYVRKECIQLAKLLMKMTPKVK